MTMRKLSLRERIAQALTDDVLDFGVLKWGDDAPLISQPMSVRDRVLDAILPVIQHDLEQARQGIRQELANAVFVEVSEHDYLRGYATALVDAIAALEHQRTIGGAAEKSFGGMNAAIAVVRLMKPPKEAR